MFDIWKKTWKNKEEGLTLSAEPGLTSSMNADIQPSESVGDGPSSATAVPLPDSAVLAAPVGPVDQPIITSKKRKPRRSQSVDREDHFIVGDLNPRPAKRQKTSDGDDIQDTGWKIKSGLSPGEIKLLESAKKENTIAVFENTTRKDYISNLLVQWMSACRVGDKLILFVVDDIPLADARAALFASETPLSIVTYTNVLDVPADDQWKDLFEKDVLILTSKVLLELLESKAISMTRLKFLLLDDVHHAVQDSHPLAIIMDKHYKSTSAAERPRIFAMLVPPATVNFHFDVQVHDLERTLDSLVFGVPSELRRQVEALVAKPTELVVYFPTTKVTDTPLFKHLYSLDKTSHLFSKQFHLARQTLRDVGPCASDWIWRKALISIDTAPAPIFEEYEDLPPDSARQEAKIKEEVRNAIRDYTFAMPNLDQSSRGCNVTPKFAKLVQILKCCEPQGDSFRGMIFVQRRVTAVSIVELIRMMSDQLSFFRPQALIGPLTRQVLQGSPLEEFVSGTINLLVATRASEDIFEIPPCTTVIRYDIFDSHVSYAHCRMHVRRGPSHLVTMMSREGDLHCRHVRSLARLHPQMEEWVQRAATRPGSAVPPPGLIESNDPYLSEDEEELETEFIRDPLTSGCIYPQNAVYVIYNYASTLQTSETWDPNASLFRYVEKEDPDGNQLLYVCTVHLPLSPVDRTTGQLCQTQTAAKQSACYRSCLKLSELGLLDYHLVPKPAHLDKHLRPIAVEEEEEEPKKKGRHALRESKTVGTRCYPRKKPYFWTNSLAYKSDQLYPTIITADNVEELSRPYQPLLLLTLQKLPPIDDFKLFFSGVPSLVHLRPGAPFKVTNEQMLLLYKYTLRMCRSISNKPFLCSPECMTYYLAPLAESWNEELGRRLSSWPYPDVVHHIPWERVKLAAERWVVELDRQDFGSLSVDIEDAIVQDRWVEFTRRYEAVRMRPDLNPMSKPEENVRESGYENLVEFCKARRKGFEGLQDYGQPLIEVSKVHSVINRLNPISRPISSSSKAPARYLIPELCSRFVIPASTFRTALLLPSITRRLDDIMLVKELNSNYFENLIRESDLHIALSSPSASVEFDYERYELLGDAYLKYLSSVYLFVTCPTQHEGALHILRQKIISNRSLLKNSDKTGLPPYIQSKPFTPKSWLPPNFKVARLPKARYDIDCSNPGSPVRELEEVNSEDAPKRPLASMEIEEEALGIASNTVLVGQDPLLEVGEIPAAPSTSEDTLMLPPSVESTSTTTPIEGIISSSTPSACDKQGTQDALGNGKKTKKPWADEADVQWLGDKGVADIAEAIIGAAYITGGREIALRVTKALNIPVPHIDRWEDFGKKALLPPPNVTIQLKEDTVARVEDIIGAKFRRPHILAQALTHASIHGNEMTSYERLEFIGDAILDFLVIRHIFDLYGNLSPGALTLLKGAMVSNSCLAALCVHSGLHQHLMFESVALANHIQEYCDQLEHKRMAEYELAEREQRSPGQYWVDVEPPKAISDVVESIIGALYVSDNFTADGAEAMYAKVLQPFFNKHISLKTLSHHPTKVLFELFQSRGCQEFEITKHAHENMSGVTKCDVICHDIVLATASDPAAHLAARRSSFLALDVLEGDPDFMTRTCYCRAISEARKAAKRNQTVKNNNDRAKEAKIDLHLELMEVDEELNVEGILGTDEEEEGFYDE